MTQAQVSDRFIAENYEGDEKELAEYLSMRFYDSVGITSPAIYARKHPEKFAVIEARAKDFTFRQTKALLEKTQRSILLQLYEAEQSGWYRLLDASFQDIHDFVASHCEAAEEKSSEHYDWAFLANTALPLMETMGFDVEKVLAIPHTPGKARAIVPMLRDLMSCEVCGERHSHGTKCIRGHELTLTNEKAAQVLELVGMVASASTTANTIRERVSEMRGKSPKVNELDKGSTTAARVDLGDNAILLIKAPVKYAKAIEIQLKGLIGEWTDKNIYDAVTELGELMMTGGN